MGVLLTALGRRRWLTAAGFAAILVSLLLPPDSTARLVVACLGLGGMLVQIPLALRDERRKRRTAQEPD
ncbi:MAG TPA: hypothetical protein VNC61_00890 [Acidimicrobiales bacterium]|nr:hypothetical protein [Acidimicrobiales bacterium]